MVALYEGVLDPVPEGEEIAAYAEHIGSEGMPVLGDLTGTLIEASGWDGSSMPGQCVLAPDMTMLDCYTGEDDERLEERTERDGVDQRLHRDGHRQRKQAERDAVDDDHGDVLPIELEELSGPLQRRRTRGSCFIHDSQSMIIFSRLSIRVLCFMYWIT